MAVAFRFETRTHGSLVVKKLIPAIIGLLMVTVAFAAESWTRKAYTEWSQKEVQRLLNDSPWAKSFNLRYAVLTQVRREVGQFATVPSEGEGGNDPEVVYTAYLRTAQPMREAVVRAAQLEAKYDHMDDAARRAFDAQWTQFLAAGPGDTVIVHVKYTANTSEIDRRLANYWQTQTLGSVQSHAVMTGLDGRRVFPTAFWTGKGASREFQLAFPRAPGDDYPRDAAVAVEFAHPNKLNEPALGERETQLSRSSETTTRVYMKFPLKDMQYRGKTTY